MLYDLQLDGLPGPTHHFGGSSRGNLASQAHARQPSSPRRAARQGLAKMRRLVALGAHQAFLPPLPRPDLALLSASGVDDLRTALRPGDAGTEVADLVRMASSSAFMWMANCATVVPGCNSSDGRSHVVLANLLAMSHRAREAPMREQQLRRLFASVPDLIVHGALPFLPALADEGAANHTRLCTGDGTALHLFVYGRSDVPDGLGPGPLRHPARQTRAASAAVARLGGLPGPRLLLARQHPAAIDAGAFHNDVVMVGDGDLLLLHAGALVDQAAVLARLRQALPGLRIIEVGEDELPLAEAVSSYLFNSQLVTTPSGRILIAPAQADGGRAGALVRRWRDDGLIRSAEFVDLRESMAGGGGPACLRLRVPLTAAQLAALEPGVLLDDQRITRLEAWVDRHYRERLEIADLADPALAEEGRRALAELASVVGWTAPGAG